MNKIIIFLALTLSACVTKDPDLAQADRLNLGLMDCVVRTDTPFFKGIQWFVRSETTNRTQYLIDSYKFGTTMDWVKARYLERCEK